MNRPVRVVLWGVGVLGRLVAENAAADPRMSIAGAIDHAPDKVGRDLADLAVGVPRGQVVIAPDLDACLSGLHAPADLVFHMTESVLPTIMPQLRAALERNLNVISAAESMFHPGLRYPDLARELDVLARTKHVSITGTGINPGFIFDTFVLAAATVSSAITSVRLNRVVEVAETGPGDIDHVGFGLPVADFRERLAQGRIVGHMGYAESITLVAERLGLAIDRFEEHWEPLTSDHPVPSTIGLLEPGRVTGIVQTGVASLGDQPAISARLAMYFEAPGYEPVVDEIIIEGRHTTRVRIEPSCNSILSAALLMVNTAPALVRATSGLINVVDVPVSASPRGAFRLQLDATQPVRPGMLRLIALPTDR